MEHMQALVQILRILLENGLRLKRSKCSFLEKEVIFCGFKVTRHGVSPVADKLKPILDAPAPENVSQLKSFLGMINFYHRHLTNLAETLEPLHQLLR